MPSDRVLLEERALDSLLRAGRLAPLLGEGACIRRLVHEAEREADRGLEADAGRHDIVDEPQAQRLLRAQAPSGHAEIERDAQAGALGDAKEAVRRGDEAELHLGEAERGLRIVRRDRRGARERELEAAAERGAVHVGDDGLRTGAEAREASRHAHARPPPRPGRSGSFARGRCSRRRRRSPSSRCGGRRRGPSGRRRRRRSLRRARRRAPA